MKVDFTKDKIRVNAIYPRCVTHEKIREQHEKIIDYLKRDSYN